LSAAHASQEPRRRRHVAGEWVVRSASQPVAPRYLLDSQAALDVM
jgi:hypothetical protein